MQLNKSRRGANMLPSRCLLNLSSQRNQFCTMFNFCEVLILLTLWQPTLLLHNRPTVSYTPAAPARCPELARNHRNIDKYCSSVAHIRRLTCTYVQLPTPADTHPHRHAPLKLRAHRRDVFQQSQQQKKNRSSPNSQRSRFGIKSVLYLMPCLPTLWHPTQLLRVQPTVFYTRLISHVLHESARDFFFLGWKIFSLPIKTVLTAVQMD